MTYVPDLPVSGESLGSTRDRIRGNFQEIAVVEAVNHVAFNATGKGKHKFLQMPEQVSAPTVLTNEAGFYSKVGTNPAETNLFFRAENNGFEYQLTKSISASTARFANNTAYQADHEGGWVFLAGGLVMQYGRRLSPGSSGTITFPIPFPSGSAPFSIVAEVERGNSGDTQDVNIVTATPSSTGFNYRSSSAGSTAFNWIAIGN